MSKYIKVYIYIINMYHSINKQLLTNELGNKCNIPNDILNIIKSFAFYDTITYNSRLYKSKINLIIEKELVSYNYIYAQNKKYSSFGIILNNIGIDRNHKDKVLHINNDICLKCGNYCYSYFDIAINRKIPESARCNCYI